MKNYKGLPYSCIFEDRLSRMVDSVNESLKENLECLPGVKSVKVDDNDDGKTVSFEITLSNRKKIKKNVKMYVDESALELSAESLEAFLGPIARRS